MVEAEKPIGAVCIGPAIRLGLFPTQDAIKGPWTSTNAVPFVSQVGVVEQTTSALVL